MKLDFDKKYMDIGTVPFNYLRTLQLATSGGAEMNECLLAASKIRSKDAETWTKEWAIVAERVATEAEQFLKSGQPVSARGAYLRACNYYRTAMFPLPPADPRMDQYLTLSRENFHEAARLFSPIIEVVDIPMGEAKLPAYFLSAGKPNSPTLIAINGGDSTNEELVHWIGFAAIERGWNCIVFEGPGQWSALQLNPGLYLRPDYEVPVKAVVDFLMERDDVDPERIAVIGYSLGTQFAIRASVFDKRVKACICSGGVIVDVYEAWHAVWPVMLQKAPAKVFNFIFGALEKINVQLHGITNRFRAMMGVTKPYDIINYWKSFTIKSLAPQLECPLLLLLGEAEYDQSNERVALSMLHFLSELTCPLSIHEFTYEDGWAASHCQVGGLGAAQAIIFNWLEKTINNKEQPGEPDIPFDWKVLEKYFKSSELQKLKERIHMKMA